MERKPRNLAIIPVRLGSERLPRKNIRPFFGKPIFQYTVEDALAVGLFDEVHVSTESSEVAEAARAAGADVPFLRDPSLATAEARLTGVVEFVLREYERRGKEFDNFCMLWATNPLRDREDLTGAFRELQTDEACDAIISVSEVKKSAFSVQTMDQAGYLRPVTPELLALPRQEKPVPYVDNGNFCWVRVRPFREEGTWMPSRLRGYPVEPGTAVDIDTLADWEYAEYVYTKRHSAP